ncbi:MAG: hypothetical protein R6X02_28435 [Enhygromyxa sp.]
MSESESEFELSAETLLSLRHDPPRLGHLAMERRADLFDRRTLLRPTPSLPPPRGPAILRREQQLELGSWPEPDAWQPGDRVLIPIEPGDELGARRYVDWLLELAAHELASPLEHSPLLGPCSIASFSVQPAGTHRLWLIAAARLALPGSIRVEARHDLIGIRLAQVALGFGADTLAGPVEADRHLPVAGVTRPTEASITGLRNLIEQAGLICALQEDAVPRALETGRHTVPIQLFDPDREDPS